MEDLRREAASPRRARRARGRRWRRSRSTSSETKPTWYERTRYPLHYSAIVREQAREKDLDPALVAAVIYQESKFHTDARSASGAIGLMQLRRRRPRGSRCAPAAPRSRSAISTNPAINIRYGAWYLQNLFKKYGNERLVLAAYNAGQGNVDRWRANGEQIQFAETRAYVERVEHLKRIYREAWREAVPQRMSCRPVLELAENANTYTPLGAERRAHRHRPLRALDGPRRPPGWNVAQRFRLRGGRARRGARPRSTRTCARGPHGLHVGGRLVARRRPISSSGCSRSASSTTTDPLAVGMVLTEPPRQAPPAGVEVRRVDDAPTTTRRGADRGRRVRRCRRSRCRRPVDPDGRS